MEKNTEKKTLLDEARCEINEVDAAMAELFVRRMRAVEKVARYKKEHDLPILDSAREEAVVQKNAALVEDEALRNYYVSFIRGNMALSRAYQGQMLAKSCLHVNLPAGGYDIHLERGALVRAGELLRLSRRVLIVTDEGVPPEYARTVAAQCKEPYIVTLPMGEGSKSFARLEMLCSTMLAHGFTRSDCVVAVGGGVVGDLAGFAAASYMRGIDFYNIPTTVLSQVDSSIGGKVAVNLAGVKNIVGAFHQPRAVIVDPEVLKTLPKRQIANGLAEAVKMSLTSDAELFELFEKGAWERDIDRIIERSLRIKKAVVEQDECETGLRRVLNFGHTLGHGIEGAEELHGLYHGECVALGMLPMCSARVRARLIPVLKGLGLPYEIKGDLEKMLSIAAHDKKCDGGAISVVYVDEVGSFEIVKMPLGEWQETIRSTLGERRA